MEGHEEKSTQFGQQFCGRPVVWSKNKVYLYNIKRRDMCNNLKQKDYERSI